MVKGKTRRQHLLITLVGIIVVLVGLRIAYFHPEGGANPDRPTFKTDTLTIETQTGKTLHFQIELAESSMQQQYGLMFRTQMPEDQGMLFIYTPPRPVAMWMKNTLIPLDMVFVDSAGIIRYIHANARPQSLALIRYPYSVRAVIELNGGIAEKASIQTGDRVIHSIFRNVNVPQKAP